MQGVLCVKSTNILRLFSVGFCWLVPIDWYCYLHARLLSCLYNWLDFLGKQTTPQLNVEQFDIARGNFLSCFYASCAESHPFHWINEVNHIYYVVNNCSDIWEQYKIPTLCFWSIHIHLKAGWSTTSFELLLWIIDFHYFHGEINLLAKFIDFKNS